MALVPCRECGTEISSKAKACPKCGAKPKGRRLWPWLLAAPFVAFGGLMLIGALSGAGGPASQDRRAISLCWEEQRRPSLSPGAAQFAAGACERMEAEYRRKYGRSP